MTADSVGESQACQGSPLEMVPGELSGVFQVHRSGRVITQGAVGRSDLTTGEPCTLDTRFQAASVSKQFVAASVLVLGDRGALGVDDLVLKWWPSAPPEWRSMTLGHLLEHSSGLPHWKAIPGLDMAQALAPDEILDRVTRLPLTSSPGSRWAYSGVGYLLLAAIVEIASGQPYGDFVAQNVFGPLGMATTTSGVKPQAEHAANGHHEGHPVPPNAALLALPGTGDVWTTVGDLLRYADGLRNGDLLSERSWLLMGQPHMLIDDPSADREAVSTTAYGYGLYIGTIAGKPARFHHGDNPGFRSLLGWLPQTGLTFAVLSNDDSVVLDDIATALVRAAC